MISDVLREARKLIKRGWTQGAWARCRGREVKYDDPTATCFCITGALFRVTANNEFDHRVAMSHLERAARLRTGHLAQWNDRTERMKHQVLRVYDRAIALAVQEEQKG